MLFKRPPPIPKRLPKPKPPKPPRISPRGRKAYLTDEERLARKRAYVKKRNPIDRLARAARLKIPKKGEYTYTFRNSRLGILCEARGKFRIRTYAKTCTWWVYGFNVALRSNNGVLRGKDWVMIVPSLPGPKPTVIYCKKIRGGWTVNLDCSSLPLG
jgi:hypothetical protein